MSIIEKTTALGAYLAALGIPAASSAYCIPILTGEKPVPTAVESALAETAASVVDGITITLVEAAKRKGVSRSTIFRLTQDGTLPTVNVRDLFASADDETFRVDPTGWDNGYTHIRLAGAIRPETGRRARLLWSNP